MITLLLFIYMLQLVFAFISLYDKDPFFKYKTPKDFVLTLIPFYPCIISVIKKIKTIGKR